MAAAAVVYVHGLWLGGHESGLLGRRLRVVRGWPVHVFRYSSMHESLDTVLTRLHRFLDTVPAPQLHLLGHSLGGLIILHCLRRHGLARPGRVVFLGTPASGSQVTAALRSHHLGRWLAGPVLPAALLEPDARSWDLGRPLGLIAGTTSLGMGRLVIEFDGPNDGTVSVEETRLKGAAAHLTLPATHMGLLFSARVARAVGDFFEHGHFVT